MEFTKEQFDEIGPWHFHDRCFDSSDQEFMRKIFNLLPSHLQGIAVSWGCDDSVFRDDVYEFLVKNQFNMTCEQYRESEIGKEFFKNSTYQEFDFEKLKPKKVLFDIETEGGTFMMDETGETKILTGIPKLDELMSKNGFAKGELGIIFAPHGTGRKTWDPAKGRYDEKLKSAVERFKKDKDA